MVMGFSERWPDGTPTNFVEKIQDGVKVHSMRWGTRWRPGMTIQMATGVRTKRYQCFREARVALVQGVKLIPSPERSGLPTVLVERGTQRILRPLGSFETLAIAINDGFNSAHELNAWMAAAVRANKVDAFRGQIITWAPFGFTPESLNPTAPTPY